MTTTVVTDRTAIAEVIAAGLGELDNLRDRRAEAEARVEEAQQAAEHAADQYTAKITELLNTGWATAEGLAAQGHHLPKSKRSTKARKSATTEPAENSE